jgi:hypothetical protein
MDINEIITKLEYEWELENGFLGELRQGHFNEGAYDRFVNFMNFIDCADQEMLPRRLISLIWYIPIFMNWQKERCIENGLAETRYTEAVNEITNIIEQILGVP